MTRSVPYRLRDQVRTFTQSRFMRSGVWEGGVLDESGFRQLLWQRDIEQARADVRPFLRDARTMEIWSGWHFRDLADKVLLA